MSWDTVYSWSQILTVLFAAVALVSGFVVNKRQAREMIELRKSADESRTAQQRVEVQLSESRTKQAEAERQLLEIQERFTPRTLTGEKREKFVSALKDTPRGRIEVSVTTGDPEAFTFASQIWETLRNAGFDVGPQLGSFTLFGPPPIGVLIGVKDANQQPPFGGAIQQAFESVGIHVDAVTPYGSELELLYIRVGIKPTQQ